MRLFFSVFLLALVAAHAQTPQVPHKMEFAGMTLTIRDDARREIQKDVNALTQSPKHHNIKIERAKTYFPIIEKVFEEERVPDDFKYLALQESALIADAVSVSNAVGFWQFKDFTAVEMGLRVDKEIDERLNIVSSSRAAARYIKKNNFYFNNWIFALQSYQMGAGGAMKSLPKNLSGVKHMEITSATYWYVKKYLAHKVAFENVVEGSGHVKAIPYENRSTKLLTDIAKEVSVSEEELKSYNKWAKTGRIPDDRTYTVIIPVAGEKEITLPLTTVAAAKIDPPATATATSTMPERTRINGIKAIKAAPGETATTLASRAGVRVSDFLNWNDLSRNSRLEADEYYLLGKKRSRGPEAYHKVSAGETLWQVSQRYGVQIKKLRRYNRLNSSEDIKQGTTIWLASKKPKNFNDELNSNEVIEVDNTSTFAWTAGESASATVLATKPTDRPSENPAPVADKGSEKEVFVANDSVGNQLDSAQNIQVVGNIAPVDSVAQKKIEVVSSPGKHEHVVQPKETLYGIAHTYNVGVMDLAQWNNLNIQDGIRPGQVLKLTDGKSASNDLAVKQFEHEVQNTDTLYGIARKYGVTIQDLMEWNNKKDFNLAIGEKLK
ncbi:MAG TPA: LysM peptidoglycan-binding domain-containing protein, partial [Chryseolinea sp.]|nr:LysM peptidoglycan-binding domain-containing protein [Chryseolinea sp.]